VYKRYIRYPFAGTLDQFTQTRGGRCIAQLPPLLRPDADHANALTRTPGGLTMATIGFSAKEDRMAKVLMLTGDGGESLEVMYPYQRHLEAGHEATIAAPSAS
jgi:hypothetical protein